MEETDRPNLGYIRGDKYSLMVDAGNSAKHADLFLTCLKELGLPSPDYVAITHWHWDHTFGMHAVDACSIAGKLTNKQLEDVSRWDWDDKSMSERLATGEDIEFCDSHIRVEYPERASIIVKTADIVFDEHLHIDLGGITCELLHIGGPHSEDSVVVYLPEEKIIFLGDSSCGDHYHNEGRYDKDKLLVFIDFIKETDFSTCVEGHDSAISKELLLQYMSEELDKLL
jgi:glyoxylase-like metal-dependent hydrolase (beta-lactamase superfamily II)